MPSCGRLRAVLLHRVMIGMSRVFTLGFLLLASSCGSKDPVYPGLATGPSRAAVHALLGPGMCLNIEKAFTVMDAAKRTEVSWTEVRIHEEAGPASAGLRHSVVRNTLNGFKRFSAGRVEQDGCQTVRLGTTDSYAIIEATALKIVTERKANSKRPGLYTQFEFELLQDQTLRLIETLPFVAGTRCKSGREIERNVTRTFLYEFGERPRVFPPSSTLQGLMTDADFFDDQKNKEEIERREQEYCRRIGDE